jgi:HrpA-like RNA helicase
LAPGKLGKLDRAARVHTARPFQTNYDFNKFGIKDEHIRSFFEVLQHHQVVVVVAPTGAGKSTFLPYRLMIPPEPFPEDLWTRRGQIIITQPRIQATRNIPDFVASKLHGSSLGAGYDVGFKHSGSPATDRRNKLVYMTDGSLINMIVRNEIGALSVIMIDEAHERSLNIDLILGLLKEQLPKYPHLKLIIASATIDTKKFLTYYGAPEINPDDDLFRTSDAEGNLLYKNDEIGQALEDSPAGFYGFPGKRQHPVDTRYRLAGQDIRDNRYVNSMPEELANKVFEILLAMISNEPSELTSVEVNHEWIEAKGDILAFLHGERPIKEAVELISQKVAENPRLSSIVDVLPLYTKLTQNEQDRALKPKDDPKRIRVVVSTNVAETSLTVEGIVHVVDSGLINEPQWEPETQTTFVTPKKHSQSGCRQRWGRAGRVQPGIAHCLYTQEQFKSFPEHTLAEIARSPIDQIILTAKAAGVGDIAKFSWIQPPSQQELGRAPAYLQQIGAIDTDGDLTSHGLELRTYPAEIEYANLMILADRFGCAVEMATLLPMLELGGYSSLLQWDRSWDAQTKRAVYAVQRGLIEPCEDDVEFYLKLWDAWEGTRFKRTSIKSRKQWAGHFFVNHDIFDQDVRKKRAAFLDSLAAHKKSDDVRPISFDLIDRVRILMTYGLCNHIYHRPVQVNGEIASVNYQAYIANPDRHPELVELHKGVAVQISPESVLYGRTTPDYFVCGKRQRQRQYVSALEEPNTIISAAFIAKIKPEWLGIVEQSLLQVVRLIHRERLLQTERADSAERLNRLFIDQFYPVGGVYECSCEADNQILLERIISTPIKISTGITYEEIDDAALPPISEAEGELAPRAGVSREDESIATAPDEENDEAEPIWEYLLDDTEKSHPTEAITVQNRIHPKGTIIVDFDRACVSESIEASIAGYVCIPGVPPVLRLRPVLRPDPFESFHKTHIVGESYDFEIAGVEHYVNDPLSYLIVRDPDSRLEIGLDPFDSGLTGRNYAVDYLSDHQGEKINITVENIQEKFKLIRLSRLAQAEAQMLRFLGTETQRVVDARILEVRDNGMYLWLDPDKTVDLLPCGGFAHIQRLPNRPDEMMLGKMCRVQVKTKNWKKRPPFQIIKSLSEKVEKALENGKIGNHLIWDPELHKLSADGRINYAQRNDLLALSNDPAYQKAIHVLFRRSNEFDLELIDLTGIQLMQAELSRKGNVTVTVINVNPNGALVRTDNNLELYLPYSKITAIKGKDLTSDLIPGQVRILNVEKVSAEGGKPDVNLLYPEDDPQLEYPIGRLVVGVVSGFLDDGSAAFITIQPGMKDAFLPRDEVSFERIDNLREFFKIGQPIMNMRVVGSDIDRHRLRVSLWRLTSEQRLVPEIGYRKLKLSGNAVIKRIQMETQTLCFLTDDHILTVEGLNLVDVQAAFEQIAKFIGTGLETAPMVTNQDEIDFQVQLSEILLSSTSEITDDTRDSTRAIEFDNALIDYGQINEDVKEKVLFQIEIQLTPEQFEHLTRVEGNEFELLFGEGQSLLGTIASQSGVQFECKHDRNIVKLFSYSQISLGAAKNRIDLVVNQTP